MFSFFRKAPQEPQIYEFDVSEAHNKVFDFFQKTNAGDLEKAKTQFIQMTGPFDEEHEYFESKLDDFRSWFLFFYGGKFKNLDQIKNDPEVGCYHDFLKSGNYSLYKIIKITDGVIELEDILSSKRKEKFKVNDPVTSLSLEKGGVIQTSLFYKGGGWHSFGLSLIAHPYGAGKYITKKIKTILKARKKNQTTLSDEDFMEKLIMMRYQFFKYRQLEVDQIYSDQPLFPGSVKKKP